MCYVVLIHRMGCSYKRAGVPQSWCQFAEVSGEDNNSSWPHLHLGGGDQKKGSHWNCALNYKLPHKQRCLLCPEPWASETIWSSSRLVCLCLANSSSPPYPFWGPQRWRVGKEIKRCSFHVNNPSLHSVSLWSFNLRVFLVIAPKWRNTIEIPRSEKGSFSWTAFPTHRLLSWAVLLPAQKMEPGAFKNSSSTKSIWFLIITKPFCKSHRWHFTSVVSKSDRLSWPSARWVSLCQCCGICCCTKQSWLFPLVHSSIIHNRSLRHRTWLAVLVWEWCMGQREAHLGLWVADSGKTLCSS